MKKFLGIMGMMLMFTMTLTSCSSGSEDVLRPDDIVPPDSVQGETPTDSTVALYTVEQLVGMWEVTSAQGICDLEIDTPDGEDEIENYQFNVTFKEFPYETDDVEYRGLYERFCNRYIFTPASQLLTIYFRYEYDYENGSYLGFWETSEYETYTNYKLINNTIYPYFEDAHEHGVVIKHLTDNEMVLYANDHVLEEDGSGHSVTMTLKRIE